MYKKLLLVLVSIISINTVKAQTEKGSQMLGVSFGVSTSTSDVKNIDYSTNNYTNTHATQSNYSVAPNYSYFIANNLDLGMLAGYSHFKNSYDNANYSPQHSVSNGFNAGIYLRKYFLYENKIGIRTGPLLNYQTGKSTESNDAVPQNNSENSTKTYSGGLGMDFVYFPVKRIGLTAAIGNLSYSHQKTEGTHPGTYNNFNASFFNSFGFSISYVFGN